MSEPKKPLNIDTIFRSIEPSPEMKAAILREMLRDLPLLVKKR